MELDEVEKICDLRLSNWKRLQKRKKRKFRKYILSELFKTAFLLIVGTIAMIIIVPLSEAAPAKALLIYECCAIGLIVVLVSFWLDKPRRKK